MGSGGRRGIMSDMFEAIFSLILISMFGLFTFFFILAKANGESFYSKFYGVDISSTAELVNAGAGDVVLRYDNLKPNLDLGFWLDNGQVTVGKNTASNLPPVDAVRYYYGIAADYPTGAILLKRPLYLALRKNKDSFAITEAETLLQACVIPAKKAIEFNDVLLSIDVKKAPTATYAATIKSAFSSTVPAIKTTEKPEDKPNVIIDITMVQGDKNTIVFQPTGADGEALSCVFKDQLGAVSVIKFEANTPTVQSGAQPTITMGMTITTTNKVYLKPEQVGIALANALAIYYRGANVAAKGAQAGTTGSGTVPSDGSGTGTTESGTANGGQTGGGTTAPVADVGKGGILLVGDSLTAAKGGYSDYISSCKSKSPVVDAKIGKWAKTMDSDIAADLVTKPAVVVIWGGTNDIVGGDMKYSYVKSSLESMRRKALEANPGARVIFVTIPPFKGYAPKDENGNAVNYWSASKQKTADDINAWILSQQNSINMNDLVLDKDKNGLTDYYQDGLHPNPEGAKLVAQTIEARVGCIA